MDKQHITPEEKLLRIIENPNVAKKRNLRSVVSKETYLLKAWYYKVWLNIKALRSINARMINGLIAVSCVIVTLFLAFDFFGARAAVKRRFDEIKTGLIAPETQKFSSSNMDATLSDVLTQTKSRNIFSLIPREKAVERKDMSGGAAELKLVGIFWSDNPQAMIEDQKDHKTYLVNPGDKVGLITIKSISQDKVMIGKGEEEWELR